MMARLPWSTAPRHAPRHRGDHITRVPGEFAYQLVQLAPWSTRLDATLRAAHDDYGWPNAALADALGVSRQRVAARVAVARYTPQPSSIPIPERTR